MSEPPRVGVLGATSLVGRFLLPTLVHRGQRVLAVSRAASAETADADIVWCPPGADRPGGETVGDWITLCPLWAVPEHLAWLEQLACRRLIAVSSMSLVTKVASPDRDERHVARRLAAGEASLLVWCEGRGIDLTILRPTMIYDGTSDRNVAAIAAWVSRWGWFPLCGPATGLRQPVHAGDVATACVAALEREPAQRLYSLSGGEVLSFRELVLRTCRAHGLAPRTVSLPPRAWLILSALARGLGVARGSLAGVGRRMNEDLSCDHAAAAADLDFRPRPFVPGGSTLGMSADLVDSRPLRPQA